VWLPLWQSQHLFIDTHAHSPTPLLVSSTLYTGRLLFPSSFQLGSWPQSKTYAARQAKVNVNCCLSSASSHPTITMRRQPLHPTLPLLLLVLALLLAVVAVASRSAAPGSSMRTTNRAAFMPTTPPPAAAAARARRRPLSTPTPTHPSSSRLHAAGGSNNDGHKAKKEKQQKEKDKLSALMAKQERDAVKKYMEKETKKDLESQAKIRQAQAYMAERAKGGGKDAPWTKSTDGTGNPGGPPQSPPKKKGPKFQQISLTCRQFSIDDIQDVTFEGSHLVDVPFLGLPEVAVFGRSNVGKSSMLNCLTGNNKKVAVVSKTPGRTQQINLFKVHDSNGPVAVLVDLPGYGYAKLPKALQSDIGAQVRQYLSDRPTLRLAVLLMDSRRDPQKSDLNMMKYFRAANVPLLVLGTKVDKLKQEEIGPNLGKLNQYFKLPEGMPVAFSSVTGVNKRAVWNAIRDACVGEYLDLSEEAQEANALMQKLAEGKNAGDD